MGNVLVFPFIVLSALGLFLSMGVHLAALAGFAIPDSAFALHLGIFVVWLPAVIVAQRLSRDHKQRDFWKAALRGCPAWMKYMMYGFFGYAIVNFALFIGVFQGNVARGFSGHWMAFYSAAFAVLYSFTRAKSFDEFRRCPLGHAVTPLAKFCAECGSEVLDSAPPQITTPPGQAGG